MEYTYETMFRKQKLQIISRRETNYRIIYILYNTPKGMLFGDNSVSLRRIWMKLGGNSSYEPPGASCTAQAPQKRSEILNTILFIFF